MNNEKKYNMMLFIADSQPNSIAALMNIQRICQEYLGDDYSLKIIDINKESDLAVEKGVYVTPMLIIATPLPPNYIAGNMSNTAKILMALKIGK